MDLAFRMAEVADEAAIWQILQGAIQRRKEDGSDQWQDGYPNPTVIQADVEKGIGYVLTDQGSVIGYAAVLIDDEPAYANIEGTWQCSEGFVVVHRVAIATAYLGKGLAQRLLEFVELWAQEQQVPSMRIDTNFDNKGMLRILEKSGYNYRGEVYFRGKPRKAYEKVFGKAID